MEGISRGYEHFRRLSPGGETPPSTAGGRHATTIGGPFHTDFVGLTANLFPVVFVNNGSDIVDIESK